MMGIRHAILASAILLASPVARADDASEAQLQFELGTELYRQRRFPEAVERFIASNRLVPNASVTFNVAQTYALMDRPADAYNWYEAYLAFDLDGEARARGTAARDALLPRVAVIDVRTEPSGAALYVDRVELGSVGVSPRRIAVAAGAHHIIASLDGHRDASGETNATLGAIAPLVVTLPRIVGTLVVETDPPGATVRMGAAELGTTPLTSELPIGTLELSVRLAGHRPEERPAEIRDGETTRIVLSLEPDRSGLAVLTVTGSPPGATVLLDERRVGVTPLSIPDARPGTYALSVRGASGAAWTTRLPLEAGSATRVSYELVEPSSGPWSGWPWIGTGLGALLVVAGAITGAVTLSERSAFFADPDASADQLARIDSLAVAADALLFTGLGTLATTLVLVLARGSPRVSSGSVQHER